MARYIDADRLSFHFNTVAEHAEMEGLLNMAHIHRRCLQMIEGEATADVVPKSEVEWLYKQVDCLSQEVMYNDDIAKMKVDEAKTEVAREIFEEIDNILCKFAYPSLTAIGTINVINAEGYHLRTRDYTELKKKYTGETQ